MKSPQTHGESPEAANPLAGWATVAFPKAIRDPRVGRENQILSSEINSVGRFPVIDQGQSFIAGYSNDETRVIRNGLPLVIFGDHTRVVKFVDFPFILGADGTKVLKPREDLFDAKFFAFALQSLNIPSRGYNRHFTLLKERNLPRPDLPEQRKIAGVLGLVQRAMDQQERLLTLTGELKNALLQQLFTHGLHHESKKPTDLGPIPQGWDVREFDRFTTLQRGQDLTQAQFRGGDIPVAGSNGVIGYHDTANVKAPGVTVGRSGSVGRVTYYMTDFWAHNTCLYVKDFHGNHPRFAAYYLDFLRLHRFKSGASVPTLDRNQFRQMPVAVPQLDEQVEIANDLETLDKKLSVHRRRHAALSALFRTLLHQLMTAQIRVVDLDLPELERAVAA
jgi:type I restriction enzyme S subunit